MVRVICADLCSSTSGWPVAGFLRSAGRAASIRWSVEGRVLNRRIRIEAAKAPDALYRKRLLTSR